MENKLTLEVLNNVSENRHRLQKKSYLAKRRNDRS